VERGHAEYLAFVCSSSISCSALDLHGALCTTRIFTLEAKLSASSVEGLRATACFLLVYMGYVVFGPIILSTFHQRVGQSN